MQAEEPTIDLTNLWQEVAEIESRSSAWIGSGYVQVWFRDGGAAWFDPSWTRKGDKNCGNQKIATPKSVAAALKG